MLSMMLEVFLLLEMFKNDASLGNTSLYLPNYSKKWLKYLSLPRFAKFSYLIVRAIMA